MNRPDSRLSGKISKFLPWLFLTFAYILLMLFYARYGRHYLNGDVSTDMVMAKHLNDEGVLFSKNFWYTTELRFLNVVNVYQLGFLLFPENWHLVRLFAVGVLLPLVSFSFIYMARGAGMKESAVWGAAVIILPASIYYMFIMTYGLCYACYAATAFVQFGLCFRIAGGSAKGKRRLILRIVLLAVLGVLSGLQGVRLLMISAAPLGLTALLLLLRRMLASKNWNEVLHSWEARLMTAAVINGLAIAAGAAVNALVLTKAYDFYDQTERIMGRLTMKDLMAQIDTLCVQLGWTMPVQMASMQGILALVSMLLCCTLLVCTAALFLRVSRKKDLLQQKALFLLTAVALVLGMFINAVFRCEGIYSPGYFITGYMLMLASGFFVIEMLEPPMSWIKPLCSLILAGAFLFEGLGTLSHGILPKAASPREQAAQWLLDNGYTEGWTGFWEAAPLAQASNGQIEAWTGISLWEPEKTYAWGQKKDHAERMPEGKCFYYMVLNTAEYAMVSGWMQREPDWVLGYEGYEPDGAKKPGLLLHVIYTADSPDELLAPLRAVADQMNQITQSN